MRFSAILALAFVGLANALPATVAEPSEVATNFAITLDKRSGLPTVATTESEFTLGKRADTRSIGHYWVYQHENYKGRAEYLEFRELQCYNYGNGWDNYITSVKVGNPWRCVFFDARNCQGASRTIEDQSVANVGVQWNDKFSSYYCYAPDHGLTRKPCC